MDLGLTNRTVVVLGRIERSGLSNFKCLAEEKARVVMSARKGERLDQALVNVRQINPIAMALPIDLRSAEAMDAGETSIRELKPDILLQQWGPPPGSAAASGLENWRQQFDVMVLNQIRCVRAALPSMLEKKWGRILIIASSGIIAPIPNLVISNSLRSALVAFAKTRLRLRDPESLSTPSSPDGSRRRVWRNLIKLLLIAKSPMPQA
jgi:3-oxoacyl-[acyl-carrier protein] reductase